MTIREHWNLIPVRSSAELGDAERLERVVAIARVLLAVASLLAIYFDPTQPARFYVIAYILFSVFVFYSIGLLVLLGVERAIAKARTEFGLSPTLEGILSEVVVFYKADAALIAAHDEQTGRSYLTEYKPSTAAFQRVRITEMQPTTEQTYLFQCDAHAWYWSRCADGNTPIRISP